MKHRLFYIAVLSAILFSSVSINAQNDTALIRQKIEAKRFTFVAQTATPLRGRLIQLTSQYDLKVTPDSLISFLPYYGRAYSAPYGSSDGGINFTSVKFDYKNAWKKKKWEITIKPGDFNEINEMSLTVFPNGSASLRVQSNNRDAISFSGYISTK